MFFLRPSTHVRFPGTSLVRGAKDRIPGGRRGPVPVLDGVGRVAGALAQQGDGHRHAEDVGGEPAGPLAPVEADPAVVPGPGGRRTVRGPGTRPSACAPGRRFTPPA
ncbi:hypothetical protein GCM10010358_29180 [Streptomyces minutiscleroticus]|uniref:Uncharacterized protein n=1 Tax=Streptomyces minutiscleroticus TaxID=68238 RepID=A0A918KQM4_9ACTN|nr:hypothetical protein GCM10010358_29180 [Streptomyces minutiscleroticus]